MGHHYVPRQHLRRFKIEGSNDLVWMYDKKTKKFSDAGIASVAQQRDFYDQEIELALADVIEKPGKLVIDKILQRETINHSERTIASLYFMTMLTRGPRQRRKSMEQVPNLLEEKISEFESEIQKWIDEEPDNPKAHARLEELQQVREKYANDIPKHVMDLIRTPFWTERTVECIHNMFWHIIPAAPGTFFVTCDTPGHTFECYGLGTIDSEFTISLSKDFALIGEHKRNWGISYHKSEVQIAKEVNRRILSHADRFIFSPMKAGWIEKVAAKHDPYLSRINW